MDLVPYGSAIAGWPSKTEIGYGQTSTKPAPLLPSVLTISGQDFKCNLCEHSFKNHKGLKIHIGKMSLMSLISPRKEHSTSVSEKPDLILTSFKLSSRKEGEDNSCQEKQSDFDEHKMEI